ncbi:FAD-binding protein [Demequina sp.]|uniref:FAD-binding protein n=1 Tax=Demequina sp. TaxID=2050685 RepID=UPI003D10E927
MPEFDEEVDLLVGGSGAAAMSAAIAAKQQGLKVLIVESTGKWGGTTSISGGGLWFPNHPDMAKLGKQDSFEKALEYMDVCIGDVGPASSPERRRAYLETIPTVYNLFRSLGLKWALSADYPDYYPDRPGGMDGGRAIETEPFDSKRLGPWFEVARAKEQGVPLPLKTDDVWLMTRSWSTLQGFGRAAKVMGRTAKGVVTGKKLVGLGGAYSSGLMKIVRDLKIPVRLNTPITGLVKEDGVVVGATVSTPDGPRTIRARAGVMLGTGGFARNTAWREKYHGVPGYTSAPEGDLGTGIQVGIDAGADVALMDDAWWGASIPLPNGEALFVLNERSDPYSIMVDQSGRRFVNESASYIDVGHAMLERNREVPAIPSWLIMDARHRRKYLFNAAVTGLKPLKEAGIYVTAPTLETLAIKLDMEPGVLHETVKRFNGFCETGVDEDFDRGRTAYDNYYGDPGVKPNPNLGPIEKGPFHAVKLVPGDLGTKGGLLTDEHARVLDTDGNVIEGLYAAGNTTASVMGRTYPGAGSTIGPATVFGYLGGVHAATRVNAAASSR